MDFSLTTGLSPSTTSTRFEYTEIPSLRQLLAPVLANGHLNTDPLLAMGSTTAHPMFQLGMTQPHEPQSVDEDEDEEEDSDMPRLEPITTRPVRTAALAARAAMTGDSPAASSAAVAAVNSEEKTPRKRRAKRLGTDTPPRSSPKRARTLLKPPPNAKTAPESPAGEAVSCAVCMCEPDKNDISNIDGCAHLFCFGCIGKWSDTENTCPLCKSRFSRISRVIPQRKKKGGPSVQNVKRVKHQDQRTDVVSGAALEHLLASIAASGTLPGASVAGSRLGYIFARMGNGFPMHGVRTSARVTTTFSGFSLEDSLFDSDEEDDESYAAAVPNFMNVIMRSTIASAMANRHRTARAPVAMPPARSHATNATQVGAGSAADNALEIEDSDDDDDVVEVVQGPGRS
jgi:hypothetical protein